MALSSFISCTVKLLIPFRYLLDLFFPPLCLACQKEINNYKERLCPACWADLPFTYLSYEPNAFNAVEQRLVKSLAPIGRATSLLYFSEGSITQTLLHHFKYQGMVDIGVRLSQLLAQNIIETEAFQSLDAILPVPLHFVRKTKRGFNQCDIIAKTLGKELGLPVLHRAVVRTRNNPSQTKQKNREKNVAELFRIKRPQQLEGLHLLLVDDVITQGHTLNSLMKEIHQHVPTARTSVASLALTGDFGG